MEGGRRRRKGKKEQRMEGGKEEYAGLLEAKMFVKGYQRQLSFFQRHHIPDECIQYYKI